MRLSAAMRRMLARLGPASGPDGVGIALEDLAGHDFRAADALVDRGLAKLWVGRFGTDWYRLTDAGREALD